MNQASVFLCSPRKGGTTDALAAIWAETAASAGLSIRHIALRDYDILPCAGCNACFSPPHACILAGRDQTEELFSILLASSLVVFASPIYFYALPAHFKAFIDRGQRFWARSGKEPQKQPPLAGLAIMAAGRPRGEKLFSGALRTLRWFGHALNMNIDESLTFRGLDKPDDLKSNPEIQPLLKESAKSWASRLAALKGLSG